ncbi:hypothetical protein [Paraburkholderia pallida]|uniref:Uncharacterized protein n=1 Tax=Paraburkholderia pallida TaxID=2547399 RepID=A0A4P7CZ09_9BURK|nr:hypothetical protein [Paraburkholderia pallida]QBR00087.1 hypothetical protein E1956_23645 [Paraburkholderia pallida]
MNRCETHRKFIPSEKSRNTESQHYLLVNCGAFVQAREGVEWSIHARIQQDGASGSWSSGEVWSDVKTDDGKDTLDESTLKARLHDCVTHVMSIGLLESNLGPDNAVVVGLRTLEKQDIEKAKALRNSRQSGG